MLIVCNYKMNGNLNLYSKLIKQLNKVEGTKLILCPPFVYMSQFKRQLKFHLLGAQDVSAFDEGKSTGQISAHMLIDMGCKYTLVGHSERRVFESDEIVAQKIVAAQKSDIIPIVCVGETDRGMGYAGFKHQVESAFNAASKTKPLIVAYEPVWAIGSNQSPDADYVGEMIKNIKAAAQKYNIDAKILYGGNVNQHNFKSLKSTGVDGFLLGRLSIDSDRFFEFLRRVYE